MHITRVFCDHDGTSHIERANVHSEVVSYGAALVSLLEVPVSLLEIKIVTDEPDISDFHNAPRRQFVVHLAGRARITTSDKASVEVGLGDLLFVEDLQGAGHQFRVDPEYGSRVTLTIPVHDSWKCPPGVRVQ